MGGRGASSLPQVGRGAASARDQKERQFLFRPEVWQTVERRPLVETGLLRRNWPKLNGRGRCCSGHRILAWISGWPIWRPSLRAGLL